MKKLFAVLLALMMLSTACAFAEEGPVNEPGASVAIDGIVNFTLTADAIPEGYEFNQVNVEGVVYYTLLPVADDSLHMYMGSVAYSEDFAGYTLKLAELTDEQIAQMEELLSEDLFDPTITYAQTTHGTDLLIINEQGVISDVVEIATIYDGYIVSVSIFNVAGEISQADIDRAVQFLSDMWIVGAE